jgi:transcriptional regulator with XRE-family HTH domain
MRTKAQHARRDSRVPTLLRAIRNDGGLTQRQLGVALAEPQSWVSNCETGNRRVDVAEFCDWCQACGQEAAAVLKRFLQGR